MLVYVLSTSQQMSKSKKKYKDLCHLTNKNMQVVLETLS